jgi:hypothetical protein
VLGFNVYFNRINLGFYFLFSEEQTEGTENMDPKPGLWHASSGKDMPECKTQ